MSLINDQLAALTTTTSSTSTITTTHQYQQQSSSSSSTTPGDVEEGERLFELFCPSLKIEKLTVKPRDRQPFDVLLVQDGVLPGGTKQRALYVLLTAPERSQFKEFVYASPTTGFAQVALSYCCKTIGKHATIFTAGTAVSSMSRSAQRFGGKVIGVAGDLATAQVRAEAYVREDAANRSLIPFGVESDEFRDALCANIRRVMPRELAATPPRRVWLTVGSGTLLRTLGVVWPAAEFMPVRVGKNIWEDQFAHELWQRLGGRARVDELRAVDDAKLPRVAGLRYYSFSQPTSLLPPYASVSTYDAKLWERLLRFGVDGDLIWNVAADV